MEYNVPPWSCLPKSSPPFYLEVLKEGTIVQNIELAEREFFIIGRHAEAAQILAEHPSISRKHGVFNFRDDGALMYLDLKSAQGSFINKSKCDSDKYYRLYVGDILRLGASTRQYIVGGPEEQRPPEYDSANMARYREHLAAQSTKAKQHAEQHEARSFASWGMDEDAVDPNPNLTDQENNDDESEESGGGGGKKPKLPEYLRKDENYHRKYADKFSVDLSGIDDAGVSEGDKKILDNIKKKERKIQNMQEETRRIYLKEGSQDGGLTAGQVAAVERNDKSIEQLTADIDTLVNTLQSKNLQRQHKKGAEIGSKKHSRDFDEEDLVLDLTDQTADVASNWRMRKKKKAGAATMGALMPSSSSSEITYHGVKHELDKQRELLTATRDRIGAVPQCPVTIPDPDQGDLPDQDDIDSFISKNQQADAQHFLKRLRVEEDELATKVAHLEKLLEIVTPALKSLAGGGSNSNAVSSAVSASTTSSSAVTGGQKEGSGHSDIVGKSNNSSVNSNATTNATPLVPSIHDDSTRQDLQGNIISRSPENDLSNNTSSSIDTTTTTTTNTTANTTTTSTTINTTSSPSNSKDNNKKGAHKKDKNIELSYSSGGSSGSGSGTSNSTTTTSGGGGGGGDSTSVDNNKAAQPPIRRAVVGPSFRPSKRDDAPVVGSGRTLEGGDIVWVPPTTQSGDGKTSLNSKYGY